MSFLEATYSEVGGIASSEMLPNLVGGFLCVGSLLRDHLLDLLLSDVHLRVYLVGMEQRLLNQLLVVVGHHAVTAFATPLLHFILLTIPSAASAVRP